MYLKGMEVSGFKSFAKKTEFQFEDGITAIVGPNGSGKSNVADAMRWVLGEQSAKQLRSSSMQDVIFAGTENRRAQSYAYVNMIFDNRDHALPLEYDEITIGRRVYRSGESEYLINNTSCRLKDIQELFYDTGVGKEGYSIIGQGQIDKILSGKPEDRRELFDEAAGIVKYKKRKIQAMNRLAKEEESLIRVEDILRVKESQEKPLHDQAEKAKAYHKLHEELKIQEVNDFLVEQAVSTLELARVTKAYEDGSFQLNQTREASITVQNQYEAYSKENEALETALLELRGQIQDQRNEQAALRQEVQVLSTQIQADQHMINLFQEQKSALEQEITGQKEGAAALQAEYEEQKGLRDELAEAHGEILKEVTQISQNINKTEGELEEQRILEGKLAERRSVYLVNQEKFATIAQQKERQYASLQGRELEFKALNAQLKDSLNDKMQERKALQERIRQAKQDWTDLAEAIEQQRQIMNTAAKEASDKHQEMQRMQARLTSLQNIAERYEGFGGGVRQLMNQKQKYPGIRGVVADLISVQARYETAIETALGGAMQNVVTDNEKTTKACIEYLKNAKAGRATFLPITTVKPKGRFTDSSALKKPGVLGTADTLVKTDPEYEDIIKSLLGKVLVVDTMDHALSVANAYHYSFRIVTLEGESLNAGGSISGGAYKNKSTLLGRRRELEELEDQVNRCKAANEKAVTRLSLEQNHLEMKRQEQNKQREVQQELTIAWNGLEMTLNQLKEQLEQVKQDREQVKKDMMFLQEEQSDTGKEQKLVERNAAEIEERYGTCKSQIAYLEEALTEYRESLTEVKDESTQMQIDLAAKDAKLSHLLESISRIENEQEQRDERAKELTEQQIELTQGLTSKRDHIAACEQQEKALSKSLAEEEQEEATKQERKSYLQRELGTLFTQQNALSETVTDLEKEIIRLENQKNSLEETLESKTSHLWEEYELTPSQCEGLRLDPMPPRQDMLITIQQLKAKIRRLGSINPNAVEEFEALSKELTFMREQHDDLVHARENLQILIDQLNHSMEKQFREKFKDIQQEFNRVFKELFGGGTGTLELQEQNNELESGILINVQPPGKKLQNMMQLSGGEKALTAISLLFAILNLKPSPFCMLDEIEAALDDSNVDRFAAYLGRLKQDTQFIVITHRRGTMYIADQLYGITMQEKGVSSLVSVDLTDAVAE